MSETELQELSREAAGCLPAGFTFDDSSLRVDETGCMWDVDGEYSETSGHWLVDSTLACTEIHVRILMPLRVDLDWVSEECILASQRLNYQGSGPSRIIVPHAIVQGPMLTFRVAVLRALVSLKS